MRVLEQRGKENALRLPPTQSAFAVLAAASVFAASPAWMHAQSVSDSLPDAPSSVLLAANASTLPYQNASQDTDTLQARPQKTQPLPATAGGAASQGHREVAPLRSDQAASAELSPCPKDAQTGHVPKIFLPSNTQASCQPQDQLQLIVDAGHVTPLTSTQKGVLAIRAVTDPFNLLTIAGFSAISVAANSHSAYGPGFAGWGRLSGYSLAEDIQGEFTGTFLIPSLVHEDPRYHRMPKASVSRRIEHALIHSFVSQHDDGAVMPNYATLLNAPISAEISNLYVPGVATDASSTAKRVLVSYGTDPIGPLVAEFLPDVAKRIHVNIIFEQQILNRIALGAGSQPEP